MSNLTPIQSKLLGVRLLSDLKKGIWKHGAVKMFLTRGALRSVFKPMLYSKEDRFHAEFVNVYNAAAKALDTNVSASKTLVQWLALAPMRFFEENFLSDESGNVLVPLIKQADIENPVQCAHFTQALALWYFEQFLKNSEEFRIAIGYDMEFVEDIVGQIYGRKNLTLDYLKYFREKFDTDKLEVDPLDWPLVYYYDLCDMLYSTEDKIFEAIGEWNDDLIARTEYSTLAMVYFTECKKKTLAISG
jgi:hypothetical protein